MALRKFAVCINKAMRLNYEMSSRIRLFSSEKCARGNSIPQHLCVLPNLHLRGPCDSVPSQASSLPAKEILDPFLPMQKRMYMPTISINVIKVYQDLNTTRAIVDPRSVSSISDPLQRVTKLANMIRIRRRKMRKHKLRKLRKRMKFVFAKIKMKRQLRKEQAFRIELLSKVEAADIYDARKYVANILHTLRYHPKPDTEEELKEKLRLLKKKNKYNTTFIRPRFDD